MNLMPSPPWLSAAPRLSGGRGTVLGTIIGAFIMSVLTNGLRVMGVQEEWKIVVTGIIIIVAVFIDIVLRKKM